MYTVYFTRNGIRAWLPSLTANPYTFGKLIDTHCAVAWDLTPARPGVTGVEALDAIFTEFQCDLMLPAGREHWIKHCKLCGTDPYHTSMAVGDIIYDQEENQYWLVTTGRRYWHIDFVPLPN